MRNAGNLSRKEALTELTLSAVYLLTTALFIGLRPEHLLIIGVFNVFFFAGKATRKLAVALIPFALFGISYDWMRIVPNYEVNTVDIQPLYETEKALFGVTYEGHRIILGELFNLHHRPWADFMAGVFYLCWVPVPIAFGLWLYFRGQRGHYLHFACAFLLVNLIGFCGYYIHPAAPPWYVMSHGFGFDLTTPGDTAGLGRFDEMLGISVFSSIYGRNANIFAAVPSLHAAYMLIAFVYAYISRQHVAVRILFAVITVGIWCTAVYTGHHYIVDVLLGIACALFGIWLFELVLMRIPSFKAFINRYTDYIS